MRTAVTTLNHRAAVDVLSASHKLLLELVVILHSVHSTCVSDAALYNNTQIGKQLCRTKTINRNLADFC